MLPFDNYQSSGDRVCGPNVLFSERPCSVYAHNSSLLQPAMTRS